MKYRLKHLAEYLALRSVAALVQVLPYRGALAAGWGLAWVGFHVIRFRRREAERRVREVFGERVSGRDARRIAWESLRNLVFTAVEIMRAPAMTLEGFRKIADYEDLFTVLRQQQASGRGAICAFPHMGSWELAGRVMLLQGLPVFSVAGKQRNPLFDRYLNETREKMGVPITMRGASTLRTIVKGLKTGGMLALLPDVRMRTEAVKVRFLGKEANVGAGMALFARHAGVPIYPVIVKRIGWSRHSGQILPPIHADPTLDKQADVQRMTQQVMDIVTQAIYGDPGQWFWYNKRWVLDPVE